MIEAPEGPAVRIVAARTVLREAALVHIGGRVARDAAGVGVLEGLPRVALLTRGRGVKAEQRKHGEIVIEGDPRRPALLPVATIACLTLLPRVGIPVPVTGDARRFQRPTEGALDVARRTRQVGVSAAKRKVRVARVPEDRGREPTFIVTACAVGTIAALVDVVTPMTRYAVGCELLFLRRADVALRAFELLVRTTKGKRGIPRVVELRRLPARGRVTLAAVVAEFAAVGIVEPMAADTVRGCIPISLLPVAETARYVPVPTRKRKTRLVVVEARVPPAPGCVAVAATLAQLPSVGVIATMTGRAGPGRLAVARCGGMAGRAGETSVGTGQGEVRVRVIERFRIQTQQVRVAAAMVRMALATRARRRGESTVEALAASLVFSDVLMTDQTQFGLSGAVEGPMAALALRFRLGVGPSHRARHDERSELDGGGGRRGHPPEQAGDEERRGGCDSHPGPQNRWTATT